MKISLVIGPSKGPSEVSLARAWSDDWFQKLPPELWSVEYLELLARLAGNSYSIFHMIPWKVCLTATYGKFTSLAAEAEGEEEADQGSEDGPREAVGGRRRRPEVRRPEAAVPGAPATRASGEAGGGETHTEAEGAQPHRPGPPGASRAGLES